MPVAIGQHSITHLCDGSTSEDQYAANTSLTVAPSGGWSSAVPSLQTGSYVWKRSRAVHADGTYGPWSDAVRITGAIGQFAITTGFKYLSAVAGSITGMSRVVIAAILGLIFLAEIPTWNVVIGSGILFGAIFWLTMFSQKNKPT